MIAFLILYSLALVAIGLWAARRVKGPDDFFVAGRNLSPPLLFSTFLAANLGAGTTVGAAEFGYRSGLSAWWWVGSAGLGSLVLAFAVGPRIHRLARQHNLLTVGDFLELRYNQTARLLMAALLWLGSLSILAAQIIAIGVVLHAVAGIPEQWGCALGGAIVIAYFTAGGLWSAAWVNMFQVAVKMAGFALAAPWAWRAVGGWDALAQAAESQSALPAADYLSLTGIGLKGILHYAAILIPSFFVSPGLLQKIYGARDEATVRWAVGAQGVLLLGYSFLPVLLGMIALARFPRLDNPALALPALLAEELPFWLGGLMLAAIFSAEVSSADAVLFMISTSVARDFAQRVLSRQMNDERLLLVTRVTAVAAGAAGVALAIGLQSILAALTIFYTLLTVTLFVPLLAGLYAKRPGPAAAVAAMSAGAPATLAAHLATDGAGWGLLTPALAGIAVSAVTFFIFSGRKTRMAPV